LIFHHAQRISSTTSTSTSLREITFGVGTCPSVQKIWNTSVPFRAERYCSAEITTCSGMPKRRHGRYGFEELLCVYLLQPVFIVVPKNKVLFSLQEIKIFFWRPMAAEDKVSNDIDRVIFVNLAIPAFDQFFVHLVCVLERALTMPNDIGVPQMQVCGIENHRITPCATQV